MEKDSIKRLIFLIVVIAVFGMILYPLFDLIYYKYIINSKFVYDINKHIIEPVGFAFILGLLLWIVDKKKSKK